MTKLTKRKGFNFFRSYFDVYNELETNEDKVAFIDALLDRQFMGIKPANLKGMAKFAYVSQTNSIDSQVKGYEDKTGNYFTPTEGGGVGVIIPPSLQVEVKEQVKVEENNISLTLENDFNQFWDAYDKKNDLAKCRAKFLKLTKAEITKIKASVNEYVNSTPDKQYRKNPLTWLNGKCWEDLINTPSQSIGKTNQKLMTYDD